MIYLSLFLVSFGAATLLPFGSEALFVYDISINQHYFLLWLTATLGNTLGSIVNYYLGNRGERYLEEKQKISSAKITKYKKYFNRFGGYLLLLAWMPIVGDPITLIAGAMRYRFDYFVVIVCISKGFRYAALIYLLLPNQLTT
jgi:membrane protein YqaA with SNARE-associated domain